MIKRIGIILCVFWLLLLTSCDEQPPSQNQPANSSGRQELLLRADILNRAKEWLSTEDGGNLSAGIPYSQAVDDQGRGTGIDDFRADCSGYISHAWGLSESKPGLNTKGLQLFGVEISVQELKPGDILVAHNETQHGVIFVQWIDRDQGAFIAYEENGGEYYKRAVKREDLVLTNCTNTACEILGEDEWIGPYTAYRHPVIVAFNEDNRKLLANSLPLEELLEMPEMLLPITGNSPEVLSENEDYLDNADQTIITIWKVGSSESETLPDTSIPSRLQKNAGVLGLYLQVEVFEGSGFQDILIDALSKGTPPDMVIGEKSPDLERAIWTRYREHQALTDDYSDQITNIGNDLLFYQRSGDSFSMTFPSARRYSETKELLFHDVKCNPLLGGQLHLLENEKIIHISEIAEHEFHALYQYGLKNINIRTHELCGIWTNGDLMFSSHLVSVESPGNIGVNIDLLILEYRDGEWRPLLTSFAGDIVDILNYYFPETYPEEGAVSVLTPEIKFPVEDAILERFPTVPDIIWTDSGVETDFYLLESQLYTKYFYTTTEGQWMWSNSSFKYIPIENSNGDVIQIQIPHAAGAQPHRWRVWAISIEPGYSVSDWRTVDFSN